MHPLTGLGCVDRIITDLAVLGIGPGCPILVETAPVVGEADVQAATAAKLRTAVTLAR